MHRGRRTCVALLFSLLTLALLPRAGVVVHTHAGGDHHHVHLDGESGSTHSHHEVGQHPHQHDAEHTHGSLDHHLHGHGPAHARSHAHGHTDSDAPFENHHTHAADDHAHAAGAPWRDPAPVRPFRVALHNVDLGTAAPHWHPQHPCLLSLPPRCSVQALLFSPERYSLRPPRAHKDEPEYLAVARGPPSISELPTFQGF